MSTIMWLSKVLLCCYSTQRRIKFRISIIIGVFISHYSESLGIITVIIMRQYISITVIFIVHFSNTKTFLKGVHMKPIITVMTLFLLIYLDKYLECRYSWILIDGWMDADGWLDGIVDDDDVKIESTLKKILIQASVKIFKRFTVLQGLSICIGDCEIYNRYVTWYDKKRTFHTSLHWTLWHSFDSIVLMHEMWRFSLIIENKKFLVSIFRWYVQTYGTNTLVYSIMLVVYNRSTLPDERTIYVNLYGTIVKTFQLKYVDDVFVKGGFMLLSLLRNMLL